MQLVVFTLGRDRYALPVERVREVIRHRVPAAGVINLRNRLVPVRDIAARVGAGSLASAAPRIVIVDLRGVAAGVMVDAVESVRDVPDGEVAPVPPEVDTGLLRCSAWVDGVLVPVLDAERVLADLLPPAAEPPAKRAAKAKPAKRRAKRAAKAKPAARAKPVAKAKPGAKAQPVATAKPSATPRAAAKLQPAATPRAAAKPQPAATPRAAGKPQPSRKRSEKATRSTGGADTGSPSRVTE